MELVDPSSEPEYISYYCDISILKGEIGPMERVKSGKESGIKWDISIS